jgi:hypothetical protein
MDERERISPPLVTQERDVSVDCDLEPAFVAGCP